MNLPKQTLNSLKGKRDQKYFIGIRVRLTHWNEAMWKRFTEFIALNILYLQLRIYNIIKCK